MASTGGARCITLSREGVLSENLLRTRSARRRLASHRGVSTAVTTRAGLAETSSSPATSRRSCADRTISDQTRDRYRTRGVGPRASTPRSSARRGPRNTSMETRLRGPWSPTAYGTPGPTSEDAVVRRSADRSGPSARRSSSDSRQHLGRRADVATDVTSPTLEALGKRPPRSLASPPKRARPRCVGARAPPHHGKTAVRRPAPRCQSRHADCPGDQATERRPRGRLRVATETARVPLQTMPPCLRPRPGRDRSEDPPTARLRPGADSGRKRPSSGNTHLERRHSCRRSTPGRRWTLRPVTSPRRALARGGARRRLPDYDTEMERNHGRYAIPCRLAPSMSPPTVPALPRVEALPRANASQVSNVPPALHVDDTLSRDETTADLLHTARERHTGDLRASLAETSRPPCRRGAWECPRRFRPGRARVRSPSCADLRPHTQNVRARASGSFAATPATGVTASGSE